MTNAAPEGKRLTGPLARARRAAGDSGECRRWPHRQPSSTETCDLMARVQEVASWMTGGKDPKELAVSRFRESYGRSRNVVTVLVRTVTLARARSRKPGSRGWRFLM
jgi:hypothetical protein